MITTRLQKTLIRILINLIPKRLFAPFREIYCSFFGRLEPEMKLVRKITKNYELAIDIGANTGVWAYYLSRYFKTVVAFEPIPYCANKMNKILPRNVKVFNIALGRDVGRRKLHIPIEDEKQVYGKATFNEVYGSSQAIEVSVSSLDNYHFENIGIIKIDTEGNEMDILYGSINTILREKPALVIEIEQRYIKLPIYEVFALVTGWGYEGFFLDGGLNPISSFNHDIHQKANGAKKYINNFVFIPN